MGALYKGLIATGVLSLILLLPLTYWIVGLDTQYAILGGARFTGWHLYFCGVAGLAVTGLLVWITEYYTGTNFRPVQSVARSSLTGHGTNVIQGLAVSMESTAASRACHLRRYRRDLSFGRAVPGSRLP